jgi:ADP-heptose:LPS heptosyltransferase
MSITQNNFFQNIDENRHISFLFVRTDGLSENILSLPILKAIKHKYKNSQISVVCQKHLAEIYSNSPYVDTIIVFEKDKFIADEEYRKFFIKKLQRIEYNISLNPVFSRDPLTDYIALGCNAPLRIAFEGDCTNITPEAKNQNDQFYISLIPVDEYCVSEIERYKLFLQEMNIRMDAFEPELNIDDASSAFADNFFVENNLDPANTIVVYPFDDDGIKKNLNIEHLFRVLPEYNFVILSTEAIDYKTGNSIESLNTSNRIFNLIGKTSIRESIALTQKAAFAVSAGGAGGHIACAVNTRNIILEGGGQFGRFFPYSKLTALIVLPLDCFGCNWECKYSERYCLTRLDDDFVFETMAKIVNSVQSLKPQVYIKTSFEFSPGVPEWKWYNNLVNTDSVEIVSPDRLPTAVNVEELLIQSENEISEGNCQKAKNILNSVLTKVPDNTDVLNNLIVIEILEKNYEKAGQLLSKVLSIDPQNEVAMENADYLELQLVLYNSLLEAENLIKTDEFADARNILNKIIETDDSYIDAINDLTVIDILEQNYDDAYAKINKVFELEPGNQAASENLSFLKEIINSKQLQV